MYYPNLYWIQNFKVTILKQKRTIYFSVISIERKLPSEKNPVQSMIITCSASGGTYVTNDVKLIAKYLYT